LYKRGRYAEAAPLSERALATCKQALGQDHHDTANCLNDLARLYRIQGRYGEAEPLFKQALAIREQALGHPDHHEMAKSLEVAKSLYGLARLYRDQGRYEDAEPLCERALGIYERVLDPNHLDVAACLHSLALLYSNQGQYAKAEPLYERALAIREKALGPEHPNVATSLENYALLLLNMGRPEEAATLEARATAIRAIEIPVTNLGDNRPHFSLPAGNVQGSARSQSIGTQVKLTGNAESLLPMSQSWLWRNSLLRDFGSRRRSVKSSSSMITSMTYRPRSLYRRSIFTVCPL